MIYLIGALLCIILAIIFRRYALIKFWGKRDIKRGDIITLDGEEKVELSRIKSDSELRFK